MAIIASLPESGDVWFAGDTHSIEVTVTEGGTPIPLTGLNAEFTAKLNKSDADNALTNIRKSLGSGIQFTDPDNGVLLITIDPDDTEGLEKDTTFVWDVQLDDGPDDVFTAASGTMTFTVDVTKRV